MKNKGAKQKLKRKGVVSVFGCDLTEYLEGSGQDVPYVLRSCAEFIETHGIVDGIYRLSGITSNIQKLRQEFVSDQCPDLTREVYLQDIHCVGSLCKLYFRELPNPLLTYELYKKFTEAVSHFPEDQQLAQIQNVIQELPSSHYRTLEYLIKHLTHLASFSNMTNMHTRNLALVWAPNLLRSKEIEAIGCNGDAAFLEVRVQQLVIEFILNHVDQIFNNIKASSMENDESMPVVKSLTLPSASLPMKLVSLEEAQARSLSASHPARKERRENSLPEIVPVTGSFFHTVVDLPDSKRKLSTKSKKWKSIFNLGRSGSESKPKLSRNGSVFVRAQKLSEKTTIRPAKSMDSLCSLPVEGEDEKSRFKRTVAAGGFFIPVMKVRTGGTGSSYDLSKENEWDREGTITGAVGGSEHSGDKSSPTTSQAWLPPEQLKVFRAAEDPENEQTSPKMCRMFYTSEVAAKSGFPSRLFPLEASPRHQRKALTISEPFAVSVPLRVSAVISTNSTPCRVPAKDKPVLSSLEELCPLGADGSTHTAQEEESHASPEQATGREEKPPGDEIAAGSSIEKLPAARKPAPLETPKPTAENQEPVGAGNNSSIKKSPAHDASLAQAPASETSAEESMHSQVKVKEGLSERDNWQQEISRAKEVEALFLRELAEDDAANALLEPLWPEIQQELKIIEPEEELSSFPTAAPEAGQPQQVLTLRSESAASPQTNSFSCGSVVAPGLSEPGTTVRTSCITSQGPLCGVPSKNGSSGLQSFQSEQAAQPDRAAAVPRPGAVPCGTAAPNNPPKVEGIASALHPPPQDLKLHGEQGLEEVLSRDELSGHKGACLDSEKRKGSSGLPLREKGGIPTGQDRAQAQREKVGKMASGVGSVFLSKMQNGVRVPHPLEGNVANKTQETFDQEEEEAWTDNVQGLELVEPWEDHQWVTSPLHSPTFKDIQEKGMPDFQPPSHGAEEGLATRPRFSRSLSLDSKDTVMSLWIVQPPFTNAPCGLSKVEQDKSYLSPPEALPARLEGQGMVSLSEPEQKEVHRSKANPLGLKPELSLSHHNNPDSSLQPKNTDKDPPKLQEVLLSEASLPKGPCSASESQLGSNRSEDTPRKMRTRPSSLNLDSFLPAPDLFKFEGLVMPTSPRNILCGQKEVKGSDSVPSLPVACPAGNTADYWGSRFEACRDLDLDYMTVTHATTGRRNSAPVSVSAVRTSFMVKMCQARAVPVIPPKIQYTQIPQPLQPQKADEDAPPAPEKKETETSSATRETHSAAWSHPELPKSPRAEKKAKEEKENSTPTEMDSTPSSHSGLNAPPDLSHSNNTSNHDAPVLRRKRTSEGETSGDNPQSSKMERPSGFSKPSYRSRPGRPQSLILFSPPFPIMDHPSSSTDSRVLLSPIRSPSQTTSPTPICGDLSGTPRTTPEGVTLRNKMTIPKNGQRLETSTSCFYQPQRRSVILDGRSGRQIE
ncbi:PREDICTED: rho GTPase-activating protein 31 [Crocodylus porosus]|uniref:rho GTPase-activating protein 31 n=1 Tax=Crocodylus porosus TaxID=8502 RepID=UPI00093EB6CF|nr:PREDICTED: rho GTPase-activating protein 31 [Crocodylus porosus]